MAELVSEATSEELLEVAEATSEATFEEFLGTEEPTKAPALVNPKQKQPRRRHRRRRRRGLADSFATYFPRVLKSVHQGLSLSQETVSVMDSFVKDIFERIADEASHLVRNTRRTTLTSDEIQTAVRLLLPGELGKHAISEATKAMILSSLCLIWQQIKFRSRYKNPSVFW
ncbi:histone H2B type F-M-like [Rhinolophus ferrumequinum]|uniref:histone H2B type F-M-like n=1 Tax=Rhinolophus ferrumequinum TaxID=59479 RepID=UPI00140FC366|nr:histone H2B type F-M-like [Rhinolophus ferrumequinum]